MKIRYLFFILLFCLSITAISQDNSTQTQSNQTTPAAQNNNAPPDTSNATPLTTQDQKTDVRSALACDHIATTTGLNRQLLICNKRHISSSDYVGTAGFEPTTP